MAQGAENRKQGARNRKQSAGKRKQGAEKRSQGAGKRSQETEKSKMFPIGNILLSFSLEECMKAILSYTNKKQVILQRISYYEFVGVHGSPIVFKRLSGLNKRVYPTEKAICFFYIFMLLLNGRKKAEDV